MEQITDNAVLLAGIVSAAFLGWQLFDLARVYLNYKLGGKYEE